jgi:uncharacterized membrane protein
MKGYSRHWRFSLFLIIFVAGGILAAAVRSWSTALLLGFNAAAIVFLALAVLLMTGATPERTRDTAVVDDAGRGLLLAISAVVLATVLVAVGTELAQARAQDLGQATGPLVTLFLAWSFGQVVCALHYAHLYYIDKSGGLSFPDEGEPDYWDFLYFACTIGMAFQVSDVTISSRKMRRTVLCHALASFVFNIGVLALSVNAAVTLL